MDARGLAQSLPSSARFVDSLIIAVADARHSSSGVSADRQGPPRLSTAPQENQPQNVFARLSASELARIKPITLTLHCLFPNDFLPALDILDRGLVHRLVCADPTTAPASTGNPTMAVESRTEPGTTIPEDIRLAETEDVFLVTSASNVPPHPTDPPSTSTLDDQEKGYEVRLHAWNCSCPTFTFSAFRDLNARLGPFTESPADNETRHDDDEPVIYPFGGTLTCTTDKASPPVCKHILACVLFARCSGLFGGHGDGNRRVSTEEMAGWCAGWGG